MLPTPSWLRFGKSRQQQQQQRDQAGKRQVGSSVEDLSRSHQKESGTGGEVEQPVNESSSSSSSLKPPQQHGSSSSARTQRAHGRHLPNVRRAIANLVHRALSPVTTAAATASPTPSQTPTSSSSTANTSRLLHPKREAAETERENKLQKQTKAQHDSQVISATRNAHSQKYRAETPEITSGSKSSETREPVLVVAAAKKAQCQQKSASNTFALHQVSIISMSGRRAVFRRNFSFLLLEVFFSTFLSPLPVICLLLLASL